MSPKKREPFKLPRAGTVGEFERGFDVTPILPYKPEGRELTGLYNDKMTKVISKYCAENPKTWHTMLPYLSFV